MGIRKPVTRAEQVEVNNARLLAAAKKVFVRNGFHAATLEQVANAAGLTKGAVYRRFASKADVMFELVSRRIDERLQQLTNAAKSVTRGSAEFYQRTSAQWLDIVESERDWTLLVLEFRCHIARNKALNARFAREHARLREGIARVVAQFEGDRDFSPDELARLSFILGNGLALEIAVDGAAFPRGMVSVVAARMFGDAWSTPRKAAGKRASTAATSAR